MINKTKIVIFGPLEDEDVTNAQNIGFDNGFLWRGDDEKKLHDFTLYDVCSMIFRLDEKIITKSPDSYPIYIKGDYIIDNKFEEDEIYITDSLNKLNYLLKNKIDYNKKRTLVYENKVLKYNEYKND